MKYRVVTFLALPLGGVFRFNKKWWKKYCSNRGETINPPSVINSENRLFQSDHFIGVTHVEK
jgi:hypothetical protein